MVQESIDINGVSRVERKAKDSSLTPGCPWQSPKEAKDAVV